MLKQSWWLFWKKKWFLLKTNPKLFYPHSFFRSNQKEMADSRDFGGKCFYIKLFEKIILLIRTLQMKSSLIEANPKLNPFFPEQLVNIIILHKTNYRILSLELRFDLGN